MGGWGPWGWGGGGWKGRRKGRKWEEGEGAAIARLPHDIYSRSVARQPSQYPTRSPLDLGIRFLRSQKTLAEGRPAAVYCSRPRPYVRASTRYVSDSPMR